MGDYLQKAFSPARLGWDEDMTGSVHSSIWSRSLVKISLHVQGEYGSLHTYNPILR